jgi:hypothetical protein
MNQDGMLGKVAPDYPNIADNFPILIDLRKELEGQSEWR